MKEDTPSGMDHILYMIWALPAKTLILPISLSEPFLVYFHGVKVASRQIEKFELSFETISNGRYNTLIVVFESTKHSLLSLLELHKNDRH